MSATREIQSIWSNKSIPVIAVPPHGELRIRLPFSHANRSWLSIGQRIPTWNRKAEYWSVPRSWLNRLARRAVEAFGQCYVVQSFREHEKCAPACWNATGLDCECSCLGEHHGCDNEGNWFVVSDTFACRWGDRKYSVRLVEERAPRRPSDEELIADSGAQWQTYFVAAGDLTKIGKSTDVASRIKTLQTGSAERLKLVGVLDGDRERELHRLFAHRRIGGEWFALGQYEWEQVVELLQVETN